MEVQSFFSIQQTSVIQRRVKFTLLRVNSTTINVYFWQDTSEKNHKTSLDNLVEKVMRL